MTNPNNAVGTNAAYGGRTSVNAFNDDLAVYSRGIMSGWACSPNSGLTVSLGGDGTTRDVAVAEDNSGNKVTINNISGSPVNVTLSAAPGSNSRIDAIVAYVDNPPQGSVTIADNYEACGIIAVSGSASGSPVPPTDGAIRSAITADGASGATAYYAVLALITISSGTTDIVDTDIAAGNSAIVNDNNVPPITTNMLPTIPASKLDWSTMGGNYSTTEQNTNTTWIDGKTIYKKTIDLGTLPNAGSKRIAHDISNLDNIVELKGIGRQQTPNTKSWFALPYATSSGTNQMGLRVEDGNVLVITSSDRTDCSGYATLFYTKSS